MRRVSEGNPAGPVRPEDAIAVRSVAHWLGRGPIDGVEQFSGGASNLTYLLRPQHGPELILRRPPRGAKPGGAHDMHREYRVQAALGEVFSYVPRMVGYCDDESVIGSQFYVMEKVEGTIVRRDLPASATPADASALCQSALDVLVELHAVDVKAHAELAALGKGDGYVERQVGGWSRRFIAAATDDTGNWSDIAGWLHRHQPRDVGQRMIHNDYRLDNLVLDDDLRVVAVLDWELATVGDPLMDLGSALAYWVEADDDHVFQSLRRQPSHAEGMWTRDELVSRYARATGLTITPETWRFYEIFGLFRLAVIAQQIWYRYVHRQTTNEAFATFGRAVAYLESRCRRLVREAG